MSAHRGRNHGRSNDRCGVFSNDEKKRKNRVVGQVVDHSESVGVSRVTDGRTDDNDEPPAQRRRELEGAPCCDCTRYSTCSKPKDARGHGCLCVTARRPCRNCRCKQKCTNLPHTLRKEPPQQPPAAARLMEQFCRPAVSAPCVGTGPAETVGRGQADGGSRDLMEDGSSEEESEAQGGSDGGPGTGDGAQESGGGASTDEAAAGRATGTNSGQNSSLGRAVEALQVREGRQVGACTDSAGPETPIHEAGSADGGTTAVVEDSGAPDQETGTATPGANSDATATAGDDTSQPNNVSTADGAANSTGAETGSTRFSAGTSRSSGRNIYGVRRRFTTGNSGRVDNSSAATRSTSQQLSEDQANMLQAIGASNVTGTLANAIDAFRAATGLPIDSFSLENLSDADKKLVLVYGDLVRANPGTDLDGGVAEDSAWQARWKRLVSLVGLRFYSVPKGQVGRRFLHMLVLEWQGVLKRDWNSEKPLAFPMVVLPTREGVKSAGSIRKLLTQRMDLWEQGKFQELVFDVEDEVLRRVGARSRNYAEDERLAHSYNERVLSGRLRQAVRRLTERDSGGLLLPTDIDEKSGLCVEQVLRDKHPPLRDPDLTVANPGCFEEYDTTPATVPLSITAETVEKVAARMKGGAGPSGVDAVAMQNWLLRFGAESFALRETLASVAEWLANEEPSWAAYRALMACRLVALNKCPGVRPVGIGEVFRRLMARCVVKVAGHRATASCGTSNLCAGLPAGIEGALHAVKNQWQKAGGYGDEDGPLVDDESRNEPDPSQATVPPAPLDSSDDDRDESSAPDPSQDQFATQPEASSTTTGMVESSNFCTLFVDARNGFNEMGRKAALWTVRHRWATASRFCFNCYRHAAQLIVRRPGDDCITLLSQDGVTQGDPLARIIYGLAMSPLADQLQKAVPRLVQPWYADDAAMGGDAFQV